MNCANEPSPAFSHGKAQIISPLVRSAREAFDAGMWLIGGGLNAQAMVMLHNAIELVFKAELEGVHRVLIADNRKLDYETLKSLLREAFAKHPSGASLSIPEFDFEKTITFTEALKRVTDLRPHLVGPVRKDLECLQELRNDVVHYGQNPAAVRDYVEAIAVVAIPFLQTAFPELFHQRVDSELRPEVLVECGVARRVVQKAKRAGGETPAYALHTLAHSIRCYQPDSAFSVVIEQHWDDIMQRKELGRHAIEEAWRDEYVTEECRICGIDEMFIRVRLCDDTRTIKLIGVACPVCGLRLSEAEAPLIEEHLGALAESTVKGFLTSIGRNEWLS